MAAMQIRVLVRGNGNLFVLDVAKSNKVLDVKTAVMEEYGIPIANQ